MESVIAVGNAVEEKAEDLFYKVEENEKTKDVTNDEKSRKGKDADKLVKVLNLMPLHDKINFERLKTSNLTVE
jgi:hypothetical protein